jgi:AhpD family alkylhydroperoxidase
MSPRLNPQEVAPDLYKAILGMETYARSTVDRTLLELVKLRASMINGCAYCVDMHSTDAIAEGERIERLFGLAAWRETPFFTPKERAALALTDALTRLGDGGVPDPVWADAAAEFSEKELADLVGAIALINTWNRVSIAFRSTPLSATRGMLNT